MKDKGFKKGPVDKIRNRYSSKKYLISTARENRADYWSTTVLRIKKLGIPDLLHPTISIVRNTENDALQVHEAAKKIVEHMHEERWVEAMPRPLPDDGLTEIAKNRLGK